MSTGTFAHRNDPTDVIAAALGSFTLLSGELDYAPSTMSRRYAPLRSAPRDFQSRVLI
jgi:hypothetical protein